MIKRTPQEIADFFRCYVIMDSNGAWFITTEKPDKKVLDWTAQRYTRWQRIGDFMIDVPADHDWTHLYEPRKITPESGIINEESGRNCQKPDLYTCQGEVHTHKEYRIVTAHKEIDSEAFSKGVMAWIERGWRPAGGISFDKHGCPYQAMVRGV